MLNIRRNVIFSFLEVTTNTALTFIGYRVVVRLGGIELLGLWSTLMAWVGLSRLGDFGLGGAATRFVAGLNADDDAPRIRSFIDTALISNSVAITALSLISYLVVAHWLGFVVGAGQVALAAPALPWLVVVVISANLCMIVTGALFALHLGFVRSIIMVACNLAQLGLALWLVPGHGLIGFAVAQLAPYGVAALAAWVAICVKLGKLRLPLGFRWSVLREMLRISLMLQASSIANTLFEPLSKMLLSHFGGMHMQGLYEAAYKCIVTARNVSSSTASAVVPAMTRYTQTDMPAARALYLRTRRHVARALALVFGLVVLASPVISWLWFGSVIGMFVGFVAALSVGSMVGGWVTPAYNLGQVTGRLGGVMIAMTAGDAALLAGGLPAMIVGAVSVAIVVSSVVVLRLNEPLIGLSGRLWDGVK